MKRGISKCCDFKIIQNRKYQIFFCCFWNESFYFCLEFIFRCDESLKMTKHFHLDSKLFLKMLFFKSLFQELNLWNLLKPSQISLLILRSMKFIVWIIDVELLDFDTTILNDFSTLYIYSYVECSTNMYLRFVQS